MKWIVQSKTVDSFQIYAFINTTEEVGSRQKFITPSQ